jgi:4-amino-4-deoxy-L-arabinose transferase-like glycosyltransferase
LSSEECICANIATADSWQEMFELIKSDGNPPLLYVLLRFWVSIFGNNDFALRCFAVGVASVLPPVAYLIFRKQLSEQQSIVLAILLATCAPLVRFGDLVRGYGLLPLLSLLATNELFVLLRKPNKIHLTLYGLLLAALLYLHHWGAVVLAGHILAVLIGSKRKYWQSASLRPWLISVIAASAAYLPWLIALSAQLRGDISPWIQKPSLQEFLFNTPIEAVSGYIEQPAWLFNLVGLVANICAWLSLFLPVARSGRALADFNIRPWQFFTAGALALAFSVSQIHSIWRDRYLVAFTPALLLLQVAGVGKLDVRLPRRFSIVLPLLIWLPIWIPQLLSFSRLPESTAWALASELAKSGNSASEIIVTPFPTLSPQLHRYLPPAARIISFPDLERMPAVRWTTLSSLLKNDEQLDKLFQLMEDGAKKGEAIWLVEFAGAWRAEPPPGDINQMDYRSAELLRSIQIRNWLRKHCREEGKTLYAPGREHAVVATRFVAL